MPRKVILPTMLAATLAIALGACGSSSNSSTSAAASNPAGIRYADCMRTHGVPNFPDPSSGGGVQIPGDINPASPAFHTAQRACQSLIPGGTGAPTPVTAQQLKTMVQLSRCMRAHGASGFPDPISGPPADMGGIAIAFGRPGAFISIPDTLNRQSPVFKQAAKTCRLPRNDLSPA